jgi:recombination protein RecA
VADRKHKPERVGGRAAGTGAAKVQAAIDEVGEHASRLDAVIAGVRAAKGEGSLMRLTGQACDMNVAWLPLGIPSLDRALGRGLPRGRIIEVFGPESTGKTTFCLEVVKAEQRAGGIPVFVDAEHALDPEYATKIGVNLDEVGISQPDSGEEALEVVEMAIQAGATMIIVDSVAALVPQAELDGDMGAAHVGLQARLMSQAMRKLTGVASRHKAIVIFINQTRQKIGVTFGSDETTTGGNALKFYASQRIKLTKIGVIREKADDSASPVLGIRVKIQVVKNKVAVPFQVAELEMRGSWGLDPVADVLDLAVKQKIVELAGSWYSCGERRLGQGRENTMAALRADADLFAEISGRLA